MTHTISPALPFAVEGLADALDQITPDSTVFGRLTCTEAEWLVLVLALGGCLDSAIHVLILHADGDDDGDEHGEIGAAGKSESYRLAAEHVAYMVASCTAAVAPGRGDDRR